MLDDTENTYMRTDGQLEPTEYMRQNAGVGQAPNSPANPFLGCFEAL